MANGRITATNPMAKEARSFLSFALTWLGVAAVGAAIFYWAGLVSLIEAWARPEYSHGYLIPLVAAYLFLARLRSIKPDADRTESLFGVLLVLAGIFVGLLGNLVRIPDIISYGLLACVAGFVLILAGTRNGLRLWAPWLYLVFMLPLPQFVYLPLSIRLQLISSEIGVGIVSLLGVPVFLDGNIIDLGHYKLQVAEACNGLRYLFPLMSFGFLFAVLYRGPIWHKALIFASSIPITILMNSVRIGVIGFLVDKYGIAQAEGFLHFFEGWVIFAACVLILFFIAFLLHRLGTSRRRRLPMLDLEVTGLGEQLTRLREMPASRSLIAASAVVLLAGVLWHLTPAPATVKPQRVPLTEMTLEIGSRSGKPVLLDPEIERVLGADDYFMADYRTSESGEPVNFFVAYYHSLTSGSGIHSPEVCIPGGGWEVSRWERHLVSLKTGGGSPFQVNRAIIQKGVDRMLVYYWFERGGRRLTSDYWVKAYTIWDSIARGRSDGALARVVTPIGKSENIGAADLRLTEFLTDSISLLPKHIPN